MGLEQFDSQYISVSPDTTIQELVDIYGEEAVRRGLVYIDRLSEADQNFRESADPGDMKKGVKEAFNVSSTGEEVDKASEKWKEAVEKQGLGIDE